MFRTVLIAAAAMLVTACVTPQPISAVTPVLSYRTTPDKLVVSVVEARERVVGAKGKPATIAGYARGAYGIPIDINIGQLAVADPSLKNASMSTYLAQRMADSLSASGSQAVVAQASRVATDAEAEQIMDTMKAGILLTVVDRNWHFDANLNWVGKVRFDTEVEIVVQRKGKGTILKKTFKDTQAVPLIADDSVANVMLLAYKAKLEQILEDPEVKVALGA
jgi:hypothetical protein